MTEQIPETLTGLAVDIDTLIPYPGNARRGDVPAIAESLRAHGQYRPIVVQESTGYVLAGNHTLAAARQLGWTQIAATFIDVDDDRAKKIVLVDNRSNDLAHYDNTELLELLQSLPDMAGTGYDESEVEDLLFVEEVKDLDELFDEVGEPTDEDLLVTIRVRVPPETEAAWKNHVARTDGNEAAAFAALLEVDDA